MLNDRRGGGERLINKSAPFITVAVIAVGQIRSANYKDVRDSFVGFTLTRFSVIIISHRVALARYSLTRVRRGERVEVATTHERYSRT